MDPQVPPDLLCVINTIGFDQQFHIIIIGLDTFERIRNSSARELIKYFCAEGFITCGPPFPKRRIGTECIDMRKKITGGIGDMVSHFPAFHSYVHMQPKDQVAACSLLQFIHDLIIANMVGDQLSFPVAEWMGTGSSHAKTQSPSDIPDRFTQGG